MKQKLLVITSYPEKGKTHAKKTVGVASYTKMLLEGLKKANKSLEVTVWAEHIGKTKGYKEKGIKVQRVWKRGSLSNITSLFYKTLRSDHNKVLLSFEAFLFGGYLHALAGIIGMLALRLWGKQTYILLHQVATDFSGIENNAFKAKILNLISKAFYVLVKFASTKTIIFEEDLKAKLGGGNNTEVLPHLVPENKAIAKRKARKRLGLKQNKDYVLYFGYLAPYKGADWLVENWPEGNTELIVAGGINPNHKYKKDVQDFVQNIESVAEKKGIVVTGYIEEKDIKNYFSAVDAVVLPYKMFMSSSGPMALAFSYNKPVMLSETLKAYTNTKDFKDSLEEAGMSISDIVFKFNEKSLTESVGKVNFSKKKFTKFAKLMAKKRSLDNTANKLIDYMDLRAV